MKVRKEKSVYHTLNMLSLDVTKKCLVTEGWSPVFATKQVFFSFVYIWTILNKTFRLWYDVHVNLLSTYSKNNSGSWLCRSRMHCRGQHLTLTPKLEQFSRFCKQKELPPTYFRTNKFTSPFQEIVDAYGWVSL